MCSKEVIALSIINPIFDFDFKNADGTQILDEIRLSVLSASEIVEFESFDEAIMFLTSGFAVIAVDGCSKMLAIGVQGFSFRGVTEPESEVVQRGSKEGFTEPLRINMTLIRRRIKVLTLYLKPQQSVQLQKLNSVFAICKIRCLKLSLIK